MSLSAEALAHYRTQLSCNFKQLDAAFAGCMQQAHALLSEQGIQDYLDIVSSYKFAKKLIRTFRILGGIS